MGYIPPHKRHSKDDEDRPLPTPSSLAPQFQRNLTLRGFSGSTSSRNTKGKHGLQGGKIVYARNSISKLCIVGSSCDGDDRFSGSIQLEPISCESVERRSGEKPLVLVYAHPPNREGSEEGTRSSAKRPWVSLVEKIRSDLVASFENVRKEMDLEELKEVKPSFVARFGKIFFHGSPSMNLDTVRNNSAAETVLGQVKRSFYTNVPNSYVEAILGEVVPKIGVEFAEEKEYYIVKVSDKSRPDATISCKCSVKEVNREIELYKIELNPVRHLVVDTSCLNENLDLRLMLTTKKILTALSDDEKLSLRSLIKSAVVDPDVRGGLRWPLGKECPGERYSIVGVWHTKSEVFKGPSMRLKLRRADRFDFITSTGEAAKEVTLKIPEISTLFKNHILDIGSITVMLEETLQLIWDLFLSCKCSST